jgi:uncharacterized membrane protein
MLPILFIVLAALAGEGSVLEVAARLAFRPLCHQYADRCYQLFGTTMVVCARCTGFYLALGLIGMAASIAARLGLRWRTPTLLFLLAVPLLVDGAANLFNIWDTAGIIRSLTGAAAAVPLALSLIGSRDGTF